MHLQAKLKKHQFYPTYKHVQSFHRIHLVKHDVFPCGTFEVSTILHVRIEMLLENYSNAPQDGQQQKMWNIHTILILSSLLLKHSLSQTLTEIILAGEGRGSFCLHEGAGESFRLSHLYI